MTDVPWILSFGLAVRYLCFVLLFGSQLACTKDWFDRTDKLRFINFL